MRSIWLDRVQLRSLNIDWHGRVYLTSPRTASSDAGGVVQLLSTF